MLVRNIIAKYGVVESEIYNFDEIRLMIGVISAGIKTSKLSQVQYCRNHQGTGTSEHRANTLS
jgi:hypothetical protein